MFSKLKYLFIYCYEATEKMEAKSAKFEEERGKRMEAFRADRQAVHDEAREHIADFKSEVQDQVNDALNTIGVATKDEVDEIKTLLADLSNKIDSFSK